jgi:hypothetical protein
MKWSGRSSQDDGKPSSGGTALVLAVYCPVCDQPLPSEAEVYAHLASIHGLSLGSFGPPPSRGEDDAGGPTGREPLISLVSRANLSRSNSNIWATLEGDSTDERDEDLADWVKIEPNRVTNVPPPPGVSANTIMQRD